MADISNPRNWNDYKLECWAKLNGHPLTINSPPHEKKALRDRLWGDWIHLKRKEAEKNMVTAREMFEDGKSMAQIEEAIHVSIQTLQRWKAKASPIWERRYRISEPAKPEAPRTPPEAITIKRLVTPDEERELSTEVCDVRAEARLMDITDDEWRQLPTKKKKEALEARLLQYAWKTVGDLEKLQSDERLDPNNVKVFSALLTAKEKLYPEPPQPASQSPGRLDLFVMQGGDAMPPRAKKANVVEIDVDSSERAG